MPMGSLGWRRSKKWAHRIHRNIGHGRALFQRFYHVVRARANKVPLAKRVRLEKEYFTRGIVYIGIQDHTISFFFVKPTVLGGALGIVPPDPHGHPNDQQRRGIVLPSLIVCRAQP